MDSDIKQKIDAHFDVFFKDVILVGNQLKLVLVSDDFKSLVKVKRQQKVYQYIQDYILDGRLHAVTMQLYTCREWTDFKEDSL